MSMSKIEPFATLEVPQLCVARVDRVHSVRRDLARVLLRHERDGTTSEEIREALRELTAQRG